MFPKSPNSVTNERFSDSFKPIFTRLSGGAGVPPARGKLVSLLKLGVFLFCGVDMPDAGHAGTAPQDRRYGQREFLKVYADLEAYARAADARGYESFWLAEHHFQHEGYEVVPNA